MKEPLNETAEGPTVWASATLNSEQGPDRTDTKFKGSRRKEMGTTDELHSFNINMTVANSTFNYTMTEEVRIFYIPILTFDYYLTLPTLTSSLLCCC